MIRRLLFFAALVASLSLRAQERTFILQEEDDSLVRPSLASDSGYTNGTRLLWRWTPVEGEWTKVIADRLCGHNTKCEQTVTVGVGQNMYTPENLTSRTPLVGDRPYGGWLYATVMFDAAHASTIDHVELYLGVIGRDSHAADAQIFVHKHVTTKAPTRSDGTRRSASGLPFSPRTSVACGSYRSAGAVMARNGSTSRRRSAAKRGMYSSPRAPARLSGSGTTCRRTSWNRFSGLPSRARSRSEAIGTRSSTESPMRAISPATSSSIRRTTSTASSGDRTYASTAAA